MSPELFVRSVERAHRYRITSLATLEQIARLGSSRPESMHCPPRPSTSPSSDRPAYQEGSLTDLPDLSHNERTRLKKNSVTCVSPAWPNWEDDLKEAARQGMSHAASSCTHVVEEEYRLKCDNAREQRLKRARIPELWTIETYPFARQPRLNRKAVQALYDTLDFIPQARNIIWLGGTGCGKTGLATSFLVQAIQKGYSGRYVHFAELHRRISRSPITPKR